MEGMRFALETGPQALESLGGAWEQAGAPRTPFTTHEWLTAWWDARGQGELLCPALWRDDGRLAAAACLVRAPAGGLRGAGDLHTGEWDVVAAAPAARHELWGGGGGAGGRGAGA